MSPPNNLIGMGALLFALGTVTGVLFYAAFGMIAGTVFGFLVVIMALGLIYDTTRARNNTDDEADRQRPITVCPSCSTPLKESDDVDDSDEQRALLGSVYFQIIQMGEEIRSN